MKQTLILTRESLRKRARHLQEQQIYTYIQQRRGKKISNFNGYINNVCDDFIVFKDKRIPYEFPVLYELIVKIEPSKKAPYMTLEEKKELFKQSEGGKSG